MTINICFGINNAYSQHCGVVIASILYNSNPNDHYKFYILADYVSNENKDKFEQLKHIRDFDIEYMIFDKTIFSDYNVENLPPQMGRPSLYRLKAIDLINEDKVLYLDSDIVVRSDIKELYDIQMEDFMIAGAEDISSKFSAQRINMSPLSIYVNSGVLLFNLKKCKEKNMSNILLNYIVNPIGNDSYTWSDQDIINHVFESNVYIFDIKWNLAYCFNNFYDDSEYYHKIAKNPSILHWLSAHKPWIPGDNFPYLKQEYFKYLQMTAWYKDFMELYNLEERRLLLEKIDRIGYLVDKLANGIHQVG